MSDEPARNQTTRYRSETDNEIESRVREEMKRFSPIKLRVLGGYEIAALLRIIDKERAREDPSGLCA